MASEGSPARRGRQHGAFLVGLEDFPDFLAAYLKRILDPQWGNAELAKPFNERHPIIQWYHAFCLYQHETIKTSGVPATAEMNGVTACFLGMAYSLYLLGLTWSAKPTGPQVEKSRYVRVTTWRTH